VGGIIGFLGWLWARIMWPVPSRQIVDFDEWEDIVQMFVQAAITVEKAGYDGVQVHSAHGYLLAEYLSPLVRAQLNCGGQDQLLGLCAGWYVLNTPILVGPWLTGRP
jgi:hypothetical protein